MRNLLGRLRRSGSRSLVEQLATLTSVGDGSTLTLDFTTGVLDPRLTFTRSSTATYINSSGYVTSIGAAPTNDPTKARFDHDPTTGSPRGLLIEGSAVNLASYSEDFSNAAWTKSGTNGSMTLTGTAPDNNATSRLLEENTTSYAKHSLERSINISAGIHTLSVWLKEPSANSRRYAHIQLADGQATAARYTIVADLQTGTITASGANNGTAGAPTGTGHSITPYPNGWYRVTISMNHVASPSYPAIVLGDSDSLFGGNNQPFYSATTPYKGLLVWGAQFETGSGASSYIPTGASQGTRNAEYCSITSPNFAPWYGSPTGWTVVAEMTPQSRAAGSFPGMIALRSAADSGLRIYYYNDGTYNTAFRFATASTGTEVYGPNGVTYGVPRKFGASVTSGTQIASSAGVQIGSTLTLAVPMDQTLLAIGSDGLSPTPAVNCRMHFRSIKYWPYAMTLADLNARTT